MEEEMMGMTPEAEEIEMEETIVVPPTLSEDAPSGPSMGEPPSASQPQPVYPDEATMEEDVMMEEIIVSPSQPQPVYPDGEPDGL